MTHDPQPPPFAVPWERNRQFVGREAEMEALAAALAPERATVALCGAGGLGKTQLALEYAYREWVAGRYPGGVFWLVMDRADGVGDQVAEFAGPGGLDLPQYDPTQAEQNRKLVQSAWQGGAARLLVFDNCEDPALLAQWRPKVGGCRVLVTSRKADWPDRANVAMRPLAVLARPLSLALLLEPRATQRQQ